MTYTYSVILSDCIVPVHLSANSRYHADVMTWKCFLHCWHMYLWTSRFSLQGKAIGGFGILFDVRLGTLLGKQSNVRFETQCGIGEVAIMIITFPSPNVTDAWLDTDDLTDFHVRPTFLFLLQTPIDHVISTFISKRILTFVPLFGVPMFRNKFRIIPLIIEKLTDPPRRHVIDTKPSGYVPVT